MFNAAYGGYVASATGEFGNGVIACAIGFARATAAEYGGDPARLTVFGYSLGGEKAARVAFAEDDPVSTCAAAEDGPIAALVLLDPELLVYPAIFDEELAEDPERFCLNSPWRHLDGAADFPVHVLVTGIEDPVSGRSVADPAWLATRHADIDLAAVVDAGDDGFLSLQEMVRWAYEAFAAAGLDVSLTVLPDSEHSLIRWRPGDREIIWDTVVRAEEL